MSRNLTNHTSILVRTRTNGSNAGRAVLASNLETADSLVSRTKGLLGRQNLPAGEGLWIKRCNSIHTFFMRFSIDAIFVDQNLKVISTYQDLKPWRMTWLHLKASSVFELPSGTLKESVADIEPGDQLSIEAKTGENTGGSDGK